MAMSWPSIVCIAIVQAFCILFCILILHAIWKSYKTSKISCKFIHWKSKPKVGADRREISDGEITHIQNLCSMASHRSLIHDIPQDVDGFPQILAHEKHDINDILMVACQHLDTITLTDQDILNLPETINVPFADKLKVCDKLKHDKTLE